MKNLSKTDLLLKSASLRASQYIVCTLHTDENKRHDVAIFHNCDVKNAYHHFRASEFMLNNTVKRLVQSQGYKDGYKLITTCAKVYASEQAERVQMYVNIAYRLSNERTYTSVIRLAEDALREFALRVDGVIIERYPVSDAYYSSNPAMIVKGSI